MAAEDASCRQTKFVFSIECAWVTAESLRSREVVKCSCTAYLKAEQSRAV
jgi:hypothetical protein